VIEYLIDNQGWTYRLPTGGGYPGLRPADPAQSPVKVPKTGHSKGRAFSNWIAEIRRKGGPTGHRRGSSYQVRRADWPDGNGTDGEMGKERSMAWFSVRVETRAPAGAASAAGYDDAADGLMDLLETHAGTVSAGSASWDATISVLAENAATASSAGSLIISEMAGKASMPDWPAVRVEAVSQEIQDAENALPTLPELVSGPEAAEILGVTPQRLHQIASSALGFPKPLYELRAGRLWLRSGIEAFAERWERQPGRPRKAAAG